MRSQYGDTSVLRWSETNGIRKIEIQGDQATTLVSPRADQHGVGYRRHRLISNGRDIMTRCEENGGTTLAEVLVEREFHALRFVGKST